MRTVTFITAVFLSIGFSSCSDRAMNKEDGAAFYNKCMEQAIASVGADKMDMVMPDYKNKCSCLLNQMVKTETKVDAAMKLLEDKFEVLAQLQDVDCN
jgi:hypothetical protein